MEITESLILKVLQTAFYAGEAIMEVYAEPFEVEIKSDNSPLTIADKRAHKIIYDALSETGLPVLSEEGSQIAYDIRKNWNEFWLVDPLDGTKEFIKKNGDFTVNIAFIRNQKPEFGVVYAPANKYMYWGSPGGSFRLDVSKLESFSPENHELISLLAEKLPSKNLGDVFTVLGSRSHMNADTESFIAMLQSTHPELSFISRGSSLKFCTLAEGGADIYPRFGPTMEWDTAAGHAVARFAGCTVTQIDTALEVTYNKPSLLNPYFIARHKNNEVI
jgi:3'(2'), 5'-bisphosphate nucleotidase